MFDSNGGILEGPGGVSLAIPPGALQSRQEIHFTVTAPHAIESLNGSRGPRSSISPPMHNGELTRMIQLRCFFFLTHCHLGPFYWEYI